VATANAGSTRPGKEYEMKYTDKHGNVCVCLVERPDIISIFFEDSNSIDKNNQSQKFDLPWRRLGSLRIHTLDLLPL